MLKLHYRSDDPTVFTHFIDLFDLFDLFRLVFSGPLFHHFYLQLNKAFPPKSQQAVVKKIFVDRVVFGPPFFVLFFYVIALLEVQYRLFSLCSVAMCGMYRLLQIKLMLWTSGHSTVTS